MEIWSRCRGRVTPWVDLALASRPRSPLNHTSPPSARHVYHRTYSYLILRASRSDADLRLVVISELVLRHSHPARSVAGPFSVDLVRAELTSRHTDRMLTPSAVLSFQG